MERFIKFIYSAAIGVAVALFAGYVVSAIHPGVSWRDEEKCYNSGMRFEEEATEVNQKEVDACYEEVQQRRTESDRIKSYYTLGSVAVLGATYIYLHKRTKFDSTIVDGVGFGLVFTSFYAVTLTGGGYDNDSNRLLSVLAAAITLGSTILVANYSLVKQSKK